MSAYSNLYINQGATFNFDVDLGGNNLSGYTAEGKFAKSYDGSTKGSFTITVDTANEKLACSLTAAQTAAIKPGRYVYDIIINSNDSPMVITRVVEGQLVVEPGVTFDSSAPET